MRSVKILSQDHGADIFHKPEVIVPKGALVFRVEQGCERFCFSSTEEFFSYFYSIGSVSFAGDEFLPEIEKLLLRFVFDPSDFYGGIYYETSDFRLKTY